MNAKQFVTNWNAEKNSLLKTFISGDSLASKQISAMELTPSQTDQLTQVLDLVLTDTMYTLLLGLDGSASIGGTQQAFQIRDEAGNLVSDCGEIEAEAFKQFHADT